MLVAVVVTSRCPCHCQVGIHWQQAMHFQVASQCSLYCRHWTIVMWGVSQHCLATEWGAAEQLLDPPCGCIFPGVCYLECLLLWGSCAVCLGLALGCSRETTGKLWDSTVKFPALAHAECPADLGCQQGLSITQQPLLLCEFSLGVCASTTLVLPSPVTPPPCATPFLQNIPVLA